MHCDIQDIGLELHELVIDAHTAINVESLEFMPGVRFDSGDDIKGLVSGGIQRGPGDMPGGGVAGQPDDRPGGIGAPPGRKQAGKSWYEIDPTMVCDASGQRLDLG